MHPNEVPTPTEIEWRPVIVQMREGPVFKVCGPLQAFAILNCQNFVKNGRLQRHAQQCCQLAMERKMSADEARLAFMAATMRQTLKVV
ncbi:DUF982 domain-containing protein [Rhizobium herbae]|uniref:DUF982 domain-containing protein n=1 Tax=Rhizobium herbae TaxID=508661 RepID=A0ABS4EVV3_9HYPH|nr:DUF982 domain-containing protein [Rhizobium herbae]MBP1862062.1 hypothetical protein [Rhizobium herbae]